jgi:putative transposase
MSLFKKGKKPYFQMRFRKKKMKTQTFAMDETIFKVKDDRIQLHSEPLQLKRRDFLRIQTAKSNGTLSKSARILKDRHGWWLLVSETDDNVDRNLEPRIVGIDLGCRSFATFYGQGDGKVEIGSIDQPRQLLKKLRSRIKQLKSIRLPKRIKNLRKRLNKLESKIQNVVHETHYMISKYLTSRYDVILLGDIKSHDILQGKIWSSVKQEFQDLSFYKFKLILSQKCLQQGKVMKLVKEEYTSKSCTFCGNRYEIGSSKTYECKTCNVKYDRDEGSSRNIFMKGMLN